MLKPSLQLKLGQSLTMTPQLQQAIRLLQLPVLDLNAQIQDALEENIMLEMEDLPDVPQTSAETTAEVETIQAEDSWQQQSTERIQDGGWNGEGRPFNDFADESGQTLREHLAMATGNGTLHAKRRPSLARPLSIPSMMMATSKKISTKFLRVWTQHRDSRSPRSRKHCISYNNWIRLASAHARSLSASSCSSGNWMKRRRGSNSPSSWRVITWT